MTNALSPTMLRLLSAFAERNRQHQASNAGNLRLESLGLIERVADAGLHRFTGAPAIEWAITPAGRAALAAGAVDTSGRKDLNRRVDGGEHDDPGPRA